MPHKADHVADHTTGSVELVRLEKLYPFPDFVKQGELDKVLNPGTLPAAVYADPVRQQFPCHNRASTYLSYLFYTEKQAQFHPKDREPILQRLRNFVATGGIKAATDEIDRIWAGQAKTAEEQLPDAAYAYVWVGENSVKERRLPLRSALEVKAAAEYLVQYRDSIPFAARHVIAKKIIEKAASFGAGVGGHQDFLDTQAGRGVGSPAEIIRMVEGRALLARDEGLKGQILKIAQAVREAPRKALQPGMLVKLASTIDTFDREHGLVGKYTETIRRPEEVIFDATFSKVARDLASVVATTSGAVYEKSALAKIATEDLESLFGAEFVQRVTDNFGRVDAEKMAEEISALPRPDVEVLEAVLSSQGIMPTMRKAAASRVGLTAEEQDNWAKAYAMLA